MAEEVDHKDEPRNEEAGVEDEVRDPFKNIRPSTNAVVGGHRGHETARGRNGI